MATQNLTYATKNGGLLGAVYQPAVAGSQGTTYDAATRTVAGDELVQNQLNRITASGSPLMTRAAESGLATANSRGLLSSSLAAGAAQNAVIENALPVAQQDAATYTNVSDKNLGYTNEARQFNAGQNLTREQFNANAANTAAATGAQYAQERATAAQAQKDALAKMQAENQYQLGQMKAAAGYDAEAQKQQLAGDIQKLNLQGTIDSARLATEYGLRNAQLELQAQIAQEQTQLEQGNTLQRDYVSLLGTTMTNYMNGWFRIQEAEMTPEEKTAALEEYNATIRTWQNGTNLAFASMPQWSDEWGMTLQQA